MDEYRSVPVNLIKAAVAQIVTDTDETLDYSVDFLKALAEEIKSTDPFCDHSVNICQCETVWILQELFLAIDNRRTCPNCAGDGFSFVKMMVDPTYGDYELYDSCTNCEGKGTVSL